MMGWAKKRVFYTLWTEQIGKEHPDFETKVDATYAEFKLVLENHYRTQPVHPTEGCLELFTWRTHTREQLETSPHNGLLNSLADLKSLVASL